ncbi:Hpt domain-containing protein [Flavobacterium sp.]|uniref:Hpt domain-containing protein n=1 Tax=Flavobacterium sp. TaxID=239 RepID=UPI001B4290E8|nr:Hpt domain-containing protein [Flavobacterium sp.]MBP6182737.1 Hpt domain-containing protein [Flavobacterium sp.]
MEKPNLNYINELSGDNLEFKTRIIEIVKKELPLEISVYDEFMKNKNFSNAAQSVHKIKHKISILGLEKSYYIAEEYENNLNKETTLLQFEFESLLKSMQEFVNNL